MAMTRHEAVAELTRPGGGFEITTETVNGWPDIRVYAQRPSSMRELFVQGLGHGDRRHLTQGVRSWTFAELGADANRLSRVMVDDWGIEPGDRVAVLAANCAEWVLTFWAAVNVGAVVVGINGWWKAGEVLHALALTDPTVLVVDDERRDRLARRIRDAPGVRMVPTADVARLAGGPGEDPGLPDVVIAEDDPAVIFFTSGTTGRSKGVLSTHRGMVANLQNVFLTGTAMLMTLDPDAEPTGPSGPPVALLTSPMFHVSGCHSGMVLGWVTGQHQVLLEGRISAHTVLEAIAEHNVTFWPSVPTLVWRVCRVLEDEEHDVSTVTRVAFGGAPAAPELHQRVRAVFPNVTTDLATGWGLTETTSAVTSNTGADYVARPTSVGRPFPIVELQVVDAEGDPLDVGSDGEVLVRGCQVTPGYWNDPEATAAAISTDGWFRTGDIGHLDADGFLHLTDRAKDVILRGAENVYSVEVEHRLLEHPGVLDVAVVGVPHEELGEEVQAVVQVGPRPPSAEELTAWVGEVLADFKVPSRWELRIEELPRNASGKILKDRLRG